MGTIRITEAEAIRDIAGLLARAYKGEEIVIEGDKASATVVLRSTVIPRRSIEECIALMPVDSAAAIDEDFGSDVAAAVTAHREPLTPPAWD